MAPPGSTPDKFEFLSFILKFIVILIIIMIPIFIAYASGLTFILERCMGIPFMVGLILLLVPGLNIIGAILLFICGIMLMFGKCKKYYFENPSSNKILPVD